MGETTETKKDSTQPGSGSRFRREFHVGLELALLVVLALLAVAGGREALSAWTGPGGSLTTELYVPAVSMAAGRGFVNLVPESVPGLRQFLDFQSPSFDIALLRGGQAKEQPLHPYQEYHRYLVASVGWVWSVWGVSWNAMKLLILLFFVLCLWEVYGISRLAMGPAAAFLVAMAFSWCHPLLAVLGTLRDFSKAPFILGAILVLGCVVRRQRRPHILLLLALMAGAVLGAGLGFRRDAMVVVPFAALVFACAPVAACRRGHRMLIRAAAVFLVGGAFCLSGWPILRAFQEHGTLAAHDTIMGFSVEADRELSLQPASYEKLYALNDLYSTMAAYDAGRRGVTGNAEEYQKRVADPAYDDVLKTRYVLAMFSRFPADMITRAYAACLRILGGIWGAADEKLRLLLPPGAWYALVALTAVAAVNWRLATAMLAFVLFFGGCTSVQFSFRHAFHLEFAPLFFAGLLADHAVRAVVRWRRHRKGGGPAVRQSCRPALKSMLQGSVWLTIVGGVLCGLPVAAGVWQDRQVDRLADRIMQAEKSPVALRKEFWDDRVLFAPNVPATCTPCQNDGTVTDFRTTVYLVRLAAGTALPELRLCYDAATPFDDFSRDVTLHVGPGDPGDLWYCFPVLEPTNRPSWNRFVGVSVSDKDANRVRGFYRVERPETLDLLVNITLPENPECFVKRQHVVIPRWTSPDPVFPGDPPGKETFRVMDQAAARAARDDWAQALTLWNGAAACRPASLHIALKRAEALEQLGFPAEALQILAEGLQSSGGDGPACCAVDAWLAANHRREDRESAWHALCQSLPEEECVQGWPQQNTATLK